MNLTFGLAGLVLFVVAGALMIVGGVGILALCITAWRSVTCWLAKDHVAEERQRARMQRKREKRIAAEREEAMLKGASAMATQLVHTVIQSQLQHMVSREADHRQQAVQLALLLSRNRDLLWNSFADALNPSRENIEALPVATPANHQPPSRGLISRLKSMLWADPTCSRV